MTAEKRIPTRADLHWPTLTVLKDLGGSASIQEISEHVARTMQLSDDVCDLPHGDGPQSEVDYRLAWARTDLRGVGLIENTARGVWAITQSGREILSETELRKIVREYRKPPPKERQRVGPSTDLPNDGDWTEELLAILRGIEPDAFERLCQRILRESGFTKVEVTGRSGDGGIDGAGVLRINLISFHVRFQCKRYSGSVSASQIRDFRGAMVGRADKGLFMTTGRFTPSAKKEAVRDGAPAIDLIDGASLCLHLKELELGVSTKTVESITLHREFFDKL